MITTTPALHSRLTAFCKQTDAPKSMAQFVREAILEKLEREANNEKARSAA